ncbi:hypothetical protein CRYO30217_01335 [Parvicella tangerina]|uniref:Uncharacterized protein n=1 Tax=Parvicella tangerina TaxID=2829795 RepID=A0A916JLV0_9FLAO|nr:hypothetical protein CRYO30217_01335 [Parvicella tangerina]
MKNKTLLSDFIEFFERNRFGAMTLMMTFQSCLGSIAAMYTFMTNNMVQLAIIATITMASNAAFIAQAPAKWCLYTFLLSVLTNFLLILLNNLI